MREKRKEWIYGLVGGDGPVASQGIKQRGHIRYCRLA